MDNIRPVKNSAYYWWPRIGLLRNPALLRLMGYVFDSEHVKSSNAHDEPVKIHESSIFLYKSPRASTYMKVRAYDYYFVGVLGLSFVHPNPLVWLLAMPYLVDARRFAATLNLHTIRADLIPHTEQVVFTKVSFFGYTYQHVTNISDLQKIDASEAKGASYLLKYGNNYDSNFVWRDNLSGDIFIFCSDGTWNQEGIDHPLLN